MKSTLELLGSARPGEHYATRHRLSWFATLQGLLFLSFALVDKHSNPAVTYLLVTLGATICLPSIASVDARGRSKPMPFLLALCWVAVGAAYFVMRVT
jgi:hypothetical protein